ncbi:MAG: response regulator transcription factor [Phycisphaerales bacterium]|nr:MAG: response regulator transcription factor [Phycisphaerales bacterium]
MKGDIRILVVDDHTLVRGVLAERLHREPGITVVGSVGTADGAIDRTLESSPDIILMDIDMPGLNCFDATRRIHSLKPDTHVIFVSAFFHDHYIERALRVRASGYLTKTEPPEAVVKAIFEVISGGAYFSPEIRSRIVVGEQGAKLAEESKSRLSILTRREIETLRYIAKGLAKKQIAATMGVSAKTVDSHAANLMSKLGIHDRVELTRFAIREGIAEA